MSPRRYLERLVGRSWVEVGNLIALSTIDSTNRLARQILEGCRAESRRPPRTAIFAWEQTAGRGRHERRWESPGGQGVYGTLLWDMDRATLETLPMRVAVGLCRCLNRYVPQHCGLKWPNDVVVAGRKLAGILIEASGRGRSEGSQGVLGVIIGFGVNHTAVVHGATSLELERGEGRLVELDQLAVEVVAEMAAVLADSNTKSLLELYRSFSVHRAGELIHCRVGDAMVDGDFVGFNELGHLQLDTEEGPRTISAGEIVELWRGGSS